MPLSSKDLKKIVAEARPLIEQQLDLTEQVAGLREVVTAAGGDWSQLKALVKAQIQDERDDAGDGKRVKKILDKADYAQGYAGMLGMSKMNEKNYFAEDDDELAGLAALDPKLLELLIEGSKSGAGLAIITAALEQVQSNPATPGGPKAEEAPSPQASSADNSEIHRSSSNNDEASSTAAPQGEAAHSQGTGAETLAGREERIEGQAASADLPTFSETHDGEPSETLGTAAEPTGEVANDASPVPARPTAADNALSIRPWCLHADDLSKCAGQGRKHCWGCLKAHADAEGMSA